MLPDTPERARHELLLQTTLGSALMAIKGYAAPEVEQAYARARELCQQVGETPELFRVLVSRLYNVRTGRWKTMVILAHILIKLAVASQMDDAADFVGESAGDWLGSAFGAVGTGPVDAAGRSSGRQPKVAVDALLLRRLNIRTQRFLRPIRKSGNVSD